MLAAILVTHSWNKTSKRDILYTITITVCHCMGHLLKRQTHILKPFFWVFPYINHLESGPQFDFRKKDIHSYGLLAILFWSFFLLFFLRGNQWKPLWTGVGLVGDNWQAPNLNHQSPHGLDVYIYILYLYYVYPGIPTTIKTMGVNITTIVYLRVLIIQIGSTIVLMVVED